MVTSTPEGEASPQPASAVDGSAGDVHVPTNFPMFQAAFVASGRDLMLVAPKGEPVLVRNFFASATPPDLVDELGNRISGDFARHLAGAPARHAETAYGQAAGGAELQSIGAVDSVEGTVSGTHIDGTVVHLRPGDPVFRGDVIATDANATIGIVFVDAAVLSLGGGGRIVLDSLAHADGGRPAAMSLSVMKGVFVFVSGDIAKSGPGAMVIKTPVAEIGIHGAAVGGDVDPLTESLRIGVLPGADGKAFSGSVTLAADGGGTETVGAAATEIAVTRDAITVLPLTSLDGLSLFHPAYTETLSRSGIDPSFVSFDGFMTAAGSNSGDADPGDAASPELFISEQIAPMELVVGPMAPKRGPMDVPLNPATAGEIDHSPLEAFELGSADPSDQAPATDPLNQDPTTARIWSVTDEDHPTAPFPVLLLSDDEDGGTLAVTHIQGQQAPVGSKVRLLSGAMVEHGAGGILVYDPNQQFEDLAQGFNSRQEATDWFTFTISDGQGGVATSVALITVLGVNDAPVAMPDAAAITENQVVIADVLANDTDVDQGDDPSSFLLRDVAISRIEGIAASAAGTSRALIEDNKAVFLPRNDFNSLSLGETATAFIGYTMSDANGARSSSTLTITVQGLNDAPIANSDSPGATTQNSALAPIFILANDEDVDRNDTIHIADIDTSATRGTVVNLGDGTVSYDPGQAFRHLADGKIATDTFRYRVADQHGALSVSYATVTITVAGLNDAPVAHPDAASVNENATIRLDVLANDIDIDNGDVPATFTLESADIVAIAGLADATPEFSAEVSVVGNQLRFNPGTQFRPLGAGEMATVTIGYTMADKAGATSSSTLTLTVHGLNDAPYAESDQFETHENTPLRIETSVLLANDSDPDRNDTIGFGSFDASATRGTVIDNGDGSLTYVAGQAFAFLAPGAFATDTISYRIVDSHGGISEPAAIRVFVRGANDLPLAGNDVAYAVEKGTDLVIDVLANDSDPDSDDNRATLNIVDAAAASGATVAIVNAPGARIIYKPATTSAFDWLAPGASTTDTITYTIEDSHGARATAEVIVTVTGVNDAPVAVNDAATTAAGTAVLIDVLSKDRDVDGRLDPATVVIDGHPQHGAVAIDPASGLVVYTPHPGFVGIDSFTYTIRDNSGALSNPAMVAVSVEPIADKPVAVDDAAVADQNTALRLSVLANDQNPDRDSLAVAFINGTPVTVGARVDLASGAVIHVNEDQTLTYDAGSTFGHLRSGQFAVDGFEYQTIDGKGALSGIAAVTVRVVGVGDPELRPGEELLQSFEFPVDGWFADWTRTAKIGASPADQMSIRVVSQFTAGEQTVMPTHPLSAQAGRMALIKAMPYGGEDAVQFNTVASLEAELHLASGAVEGGVGIAPHNGSARAIWTDVYLRSGDTFSFDWTFVSEESTIARNDFAAMTVSGAGVSEVFKLAGVADVLALSGTASGILGMVTSAFTNTGGEGLFRIGIGVFNQLDSANGSVLLVDDVRINEGGLTADPSNRVEVLAADGSFISVAQRPTAVRDSAQTLETAPVAIPLATLLANDAGASLGGAIRIASVGGIATGAGGAGAGGRTTLPSGAIVSVSALGMVSYDPHGAFQNLAQNETATDTLTYTLAAANGATDTGVVMITIVGVNDAPIASDDDDVVGLLLANQTANIQAASLLANDREPDASDFLKVTAAGPTAQTKGIVKLNSDGSVSYDPNGQFDHLGSDTVATDTFTYTISDPHGATATAVVTLSITGANDPPVARDDRFTTNENAVLQGNVLLDNRNGADTDPDANDTLTVTAFDDMSRLGARIAVRPDGSFDYDPGNAVKIQALGAGETKDDDFTYTIGDGYGGADTASVSITVHGLNDVPIARDDFFATDENAVLSIAKDVFLSNDSDPDANDSLLFIDASQARGTVEIRGDTILYDPRGAFNALRVGQTNVDSFTYWIRDSFGAETSATAFITIHGQGTPWTVADFEENIAGHSAPFGWDTVGTVRAVTQYPDLNESPSRRQPIEPPEGNWMARLDADPWPMSNLRNFLGISEPAKNHLMTDPVDRSTAVNGAAMKQTLAVEAGDIVSFRWAFDALDFVQGAFAGANDFALFAANGDAFRIMDVRSQMALTNIPFGAVEGIAFYRAPASGQLTIGFGVFDDGADLDSSLGTDSALFVDHIQVNREAPSEGYSVVDSLSNDHFQTYAASHGVGT